MNRYVFFDVLLPRFYKSVQTYLSIVRIYPVQRRVGAVSRSHRKTFSVWFSGGLRAANDSTSYVLFSGWCPQKSLSRSIIDFMSYVARWRDLTTETLGASGCLFKGYKSLQRFYIKIETLVTCSTVCFPWWMVDGSIFPLFSMLICIMPIIRATHK